MDSVEDHQDGKIARHGEPIARLIRHEKQSDRGFDLNSFLATVIEQSIHTGADAASLLEALRSGARY